MRIYCKFCNTNYTDKLHIGRTFTCESCNKQIRRLRYLRNSAGVKRTALGISNEDVKENLLADASSSREAKHVNKKRIKENDTKLKSNGWLEEYNNLVDKFGIYERIEL